MCERNTNETKKQIELIANGRTDGRDISAEVYGILLHWLHPQPEWTERPI